jgi:hypothetical protein
MCFLQVIGSSIHLTFSQTNMSKHYHVFSYATPMDNETSLSKLKGLISRNTGELVLVVCIIPALLMSIAANISIDTSQDRYGLIRLSSVIMTIMCLAGVAGVGGSVLSKETAFEYEPKYRWRYYDSIRLYKYLKRHHPHPDMCRFFNLTEQRLCRLDSHGEKYQLMSIVTNYFLLESGEAQEIVDSFERKTHF